MTIFNLLLAAEGDGNSSSSAAATSGGFPSWLVWVVLILIFVAMMIPSYLRSKKEKKAYAEKMSKMDIGTKVKTIGLIIGEIVAMDDLSVTIKTGTEENFSFITVEKRAVYEILSDEAPVDNDDVYTEEATENDSEEVSQEVENPSEEVETSKEEQVNE